MANKDPHEELAQELRRRIDRLVDQTDVRFQHIVDLQGDPITNLRDVETLTRVVNEHGKLLGDVILNLGAVGLVVAELLSTQGKLIDEVDRLVGIAERLTDRTSGLKGDVSKVDRALDSVAQDLIQVMNEVDERTLIVPETPDGV